MRRTALHHDERGAALIVALLITMIVTAIGVGLATIATTEMLIATSYRQAQEAAYGAEAALERALGDLDRIADWSTVLVPPPANVMSTFVDGMARPRGPGGGILDLAALTVARQRESDDRSGPDRFGADAPQWRLFAHAPIQQLSAAGPRVPVYLVVWVADDGLDGDGDPARDSNGKIVVHAQAVGSEGVWRAIESTIGRAPGDPIRTLSWHRTP